MRPIHAISGAPPSVPDAGAGTARDATVAARLTDREQAFEWFASNTRDAITLLDTAGVVRFASPVALRLFRQPSRTVVGHPLVDWVHADDRDAVATMLAKLTPGQTHRLTYRVTRGSGEHAWLETLVRKVVRIEDGQWEIQCLSHDVSCRVRKQGRLRRENGRDPLTRLANRKALKTATRLALHALPADGSQQVGMLFIDLDGFKPVNDTLGHAAGDDLLRSVGRRLANCVRGGADVSAQRGENVTTVARVGGDEFVVVLSRIRDTAAAERVADRIRHAIEQPFALCGQTVPLGASIGVATTASRATTVDRLLADADRAMYRDKSRRKSAAAA